jgi:hypothetical protein
MQYTVLDRSLDNSKARQKFGCEILKISWESWAPKSKFAEKSGTFDHIFLNNFLMLSIFLGQAYIF